MLLARGYEAPRAGFTLLEVVVGLLVLALAVLGAVGILVLASTTLGRADRLERAVALAEGVLDSLGAVASPTGGGASYGAGEVLWRLEAEGGVTLFATGPDGDTLFSVQSVLVPREMP
jgi:prepilin-type N-terminal cleavage/methylation domain-containing protein